jgi:hypothetical protein
MATLELAQDLAHGRTGEPVRGLASRALAQRRA